MLSDPPFRLTVCGLDEIAGHCETGVTHVLSILDPEAPVPPAFGIYNNHHRLELRFHDVIEEVPPMDAPQRVHVEQLLDFGRDLISDPPESAHLLVHCHAGVSRSTAAMLLILAEAQPATPAADLAAELLRIRAKAWPNLRILEFGDAMLGRQGTLITAAAALYRHQLEQRPHLADIMTDAGRGREVAAAGLTATPS
jgi:predicted protein tyrosine phosphatase